MCECAQLCQLDASESYSDYFRSEWIFSNIMNWNLIQHFICEFFPFIFLQTVFAYHISVTEFNQHSGVYADNI